MGCCHSADDNSSLMTESYVDIPLLKKPPKIDDTPLNPFFINSYTNTIEIKRRVSNETPIIDGSKPSVLSAPDYEDIRQKEFVKNFSNIEASTFQNIPMFSFNHKTSTFIQPAMSQENMDDYLHFMDQVINNLLPSLHAFSINDNRKLGVQLAV